jgi:uncharacterized protein (DUF1330 family)
MAAERVVTWLGLEVRDRERYARYREGMTPILERYGGRFDHDFVVAQVLRSTGSPRINRVFAISFPGVEARARFYADASYRLVRAEHFEPAVVSIDELGAAGAAASRDLREPREAHREEPS